MGQVRSRRCATPRGVEDGNTERVEDVQHQPPSTLAIPTLPFLTCMCVVTWTGPMAVSSEMVVMVAAASQVTKPTSKRARPTHLGPLNLFLSTTMSLPNYLPHVTSHTNCLPQICHRPTTIYVFSHTSCVFADTSQRERK